MPDFAARPAPGEYHPYFARYIDLVPDGDVLATLTVQIARTCSVLLAIPEEQAGFRYAPDKWSIKEVVMHLSDMERAFAHRALWFARGNEAPLPSIDERVFAEGVNADQLKWPQLIVEFEAVRRSSICLFAQLDDAAWTRSGRAGDSVMSVRALAFLLAGHELHHLNLIITRYLP